MNYIFEIIGSLLVVSYMVVVFTLLILKCMAYRKRKPFNGLKLVKDSEENNLKGE